MVAGVPAAIARAGAQEVRIEVFEAVNGKPITGANVSLYDSAGTIPLGGSFSDQGGRAGLRAPGRGSESKQHVRRRLERLQPGSL